MMRGALAFIWEGRRSRVTRLGRTQTTIARRVPIGTGPTTAFRHRCVVVLYCGVGRSATPLRSRRRRKNRRHRVPVSRVVCYSLGGYCTTTLIARVTSAVLTALAHHRPRLNRKDHDEAGLSLFVLRLSCSLCWRVLAEIATVRVVCGGRSNAGQHRSPRDGLRVVFCRQRVTLVGHFRMGRVKRKKHVLAGLLKGGRGHVDSESHLQPHCQVSAAKVEI